MNRNMIMAALAAFALSVMTVSCNKNDMSQPEEPQLEVNANNVSGKWQLVEWNESPLSEGTYVYLDIVRNDRTYTMYQNIDSFTGVPREVTGSYFIETDPELGAVIRGSYDHDSGEWSHRYIIRSLTRSTMVWVAKDDETFIQEYSRIDSIPVAPAED